MLGILKILFIWQRRELCEWSRQRLATISLAQMGVCCLDGSRLVKSLHPPAAGQGAFWYLALYGVYWKAGYIKGGVTTEEADKLRIWAIYGLHLKSGMLCKEGRTFLEPSRPVTKSDCYLDSEKAHEILFSTSVLILLTVSFLGPASCW